MNAVSYERADLRLLKDLLQVFAEVFEEPETYQRSVPSDAYLGSLLASDNFIALAAVVDDSVVGGLAAYVLRKFEQERSTFTTWPLEKNTDGER